MHGRPGCTISKIFIRHRMHTTKTVLITGGAGFIGSHVVDRCLTEGHTVRVLDNFSTGALENLAHCAGDIETIDGDLRSDEDVRQAMRGVDQVIHLGALGSVPRSIDDPLTSHDVNATGTLRVLKIASEVSVERVIFSSSSSVYGDNPKLPKSETDSGQALSPYAVTKSAGEQYCIQATRHYGLNTVRLRFFNVFGPRQSGTSAYAAVIPRFMTAALSGQPIVVHGDGEQSRDFTYVSNTVDGILQVLEADASIVSGNAYNLACGTRFSLNDLVGSLAGFSDRELTIEHTEPRPGDVKHSLADIAAITEAVGYEPRVSVEEGLRLTWESFVA